MTDTLVTLYSGHRVSSSSEEWRAECEARQIWKLLQGPEREKLVANLRKKRGPAGFQRLMDKIRELEPWLVLDLPTRDQRRAYAARVEAKRGPQARIALEAAVRAAAEERKRREQTLPPAEPAMETE